MGKRIKIFSVSNLAGETPPEVERSINKFLEDLKAESISLHCTGRYILVEWEEKNARKRREDGEKGNGK